MNKSKFAGTPLAKAFKTDSDKENKGVWRDHESGLAVRIRRASRVEHKRALRKFYKPFSHLTNVDPKDEMMVKMKAGAQELVADWGIRNKETGEIEPLRDDEGNIIQPTETNVLEAFVDQPDFFQWVSDEADTFEHYRIAAVEDASGNSSPSSAGSDSGESQELPPSSSDGLGGESESLPSSSVRG